MKSILMFLLILATANVAPAAEMVGVTMPDQITVEGETLVLNGLGLREASMLKVDVYVAGLYVKTKSSDAKAIIHGDGPSRIHMQFVRKVKAKDMTKAWTVGFEKNAGDGMAALKKDVDTLNGWMTALAVGDTMTFTRIPGTGVHVEVNGANNGTIAGDKFAETLWAIWLGPEPPNDGIKEGMLGQ